MAYKVFTNGSVLNASEINENLMQQATAVFSNSSARSAAISSPVEGQLTYLEDTAAYESFDGSSWVPFGVSASALTLLAAQTFTSAAVLNIDNVFNSTYNAYKVILSSTATGGNINVGVRYRVGGAASSSNYNQQYVQGGGTGVSAGRDTGGDRFNIGGFNTTGGFQEWTIHGVALAQPTWGVVNYVSPGIANGINGNYHSTATAYDGLGLIFDANSTGEIRIYGLEN